MRWRLALLWSFLPLLMMPKDLCRDVFDAIAKDEPPLVDGREGRKSLEVITAIYESIESGCEVRFPFTPKASRLGQKK